jgi:hypothetical protein
MLKPTLIGGGLMGLLGAIPVVNWLNCACCALVAGGGFIAAYLYSRDCSSQGVAFKPGSGALVGLVAGLFYALSATIFGAIVTSVMGGPDVDEIIAQMEQAGAPPEMIDTAANLGEMLTTFTGVIILFFITLLIAAIFSTIGGLIGGAVFKVEPTPPPAGTTPGDSGTA